MKRLFILMIAALALSCGSCAAVGTAQAKEKSIVSRGNIIYQQDGMEVALYEEDLLLLKNKLSTIPEDTFDPKGYACTALQETANEPVLTDGSNRRIRGDIDETVFDREYESVEEQTETETEEDSTSAYPSDGNSPETGDTEDDTPSTDPSGENSSENGDAEYIIAPTDPSEENSPETEDAEDVSTPTGPSEENLTESEDVEGDSVSDDVPTENLPVVRDIGEQIITEK